MRTSQWISGTSMVLALVGATACGAEVEPTAPARDLSASLAMAPGFLPADDSDLIARAQELVAVTSAGRAPDNATLAKLSQLRTDLSARAAQRGLAGTTLQTTMRLQQQDDCNITCPQVKIFQGRNGEANVCFLTGFGCVRDSLITSYCSYDCLPAVKVRWS
jgi:hypothetical protein